MPTSPGEKLASLRRVKPKLSQEELGRRMGKGYSRVVIANYETGRTEIPLEAAKRIADIWATTAEWLLDESDDGPPPLRNAYPGAAPTPSSIPGTKHRYAVVGVAGASVSPIATDLTGDTVAFDEELMGEGDRFVIQAKGRSMEKRISDGSYILVEPIKTRKRMPYGLLTVARNSDWEYIVKVLRSRGGQDWLDPLNPDFEPIRPADGWGIVGFVVGIKHKRGPGKYLEEGDTDGLGPDF